MTRNLFALVILLFVGLRAFSQESKGDIFHKQANEILDAGDSEKATKVFLNARQEYLKERNYERYFNSTQSASIILQDTGQGKAAEKLILETIAVIPRNSNDNLELHAKAQDNLAYTYLFVLNQTEDALKAYSESIQLYEKAGKANGTDQAFELINRATVYYDLSQFQSSVNDMLKAIAIYEKDPATKPKTLAEYYNMLGVNYNELEDFGNATKSFQHGMSLINGLDEKEMMAKFYHGLGINDFNQGSFQKALEYFSQAKSINESLNGKEDPIYAQNLISIGNAYKEMGDIDAAMGNFQEVLAIYTKAPPTEMSDLIDLTLNISRVTNDLGILDQSKALQQQALILATTQYGKNSLQEANVYMSMAATAFENGEFDESLNYNFKALTLLQSNNSVSYGDYADIYNNLGQAYDELQDIELALKYKNQALELYKKLRGPIHSSVAMATSNIGLTYEMAEQYDKSIDYLKQSINIRLKTQPATHEDVGKLHLNMGLVYLKKKDSRSSVEHLEKARAIFDGYAKNVTKAQIYNRLGAGYDMMKDYTKASACYQKALIANTFNFNDENIESSPEKPDFLSYYEIIVSYISKADVYSKRGDKANLLKGISELDAADAILKEKALHLSNPKDRLELAQLNTFFTESGMLLSDKLYRLTKEPVYLEKAYYYSERSKANELFADIQMSKPVALSRIPKKMMSRRAELSKRLNTLQQQIATAYTSQNQSLMTKLKAQEFDLKKDYQVVQTEISNLSPAFNPTISRALPSWSEVKKKLSPGTAIVSYTITDSAKFILIGNQSKLILKSIDPKIDIEKLVRGFSNLIKFQGTTLKQTTDKLTDILWTPVEEAFAEMGGIQNIIIVPEGPLNYLPFETLGKDKYLVEKYTIHYQFSGALFMNSIQNTIRNKPSFIAMAPVFDDKKTNFVNKSCERFVTSTKKADATNRAFSANGDYISPLPATEIEVEKINKIHLDKGIFSKFFVNESASEELIKKGELEDFDYIHLATHGFVNSQYPELSGLLLTQDPASLEDGVLYSGEILGLTLKADLVTLSACETALGKKVEGEGVRGLTTAFLFAGAKSVVASFWKVADESTAMLMIAFYTELLSGKDKASALRQAKLNLIVDQKYNHPYYWAPFVQIGGN